MYKYAQVCGTCEFSSRGWTGLNMFLITLELTNHSKKMKRLYARRFMCKSRTDRVAKGLCQRVAQKVVSERGALDLQYSVNTTGMSMNVKVLWALPWRGATPLPIHYLFITYSITYSITFYPRLGISHYLFENGINELS